MSQELFDTKKTEGSLEIKADFFDKINVPKTRLRRLKRIANTHNEKNLLIPSKNRPYEIYVYHMIDREPYVTTVFPM